MHAENSSRNSADNPLASLLPAKSGKPGKSGAAKKKRRGPDRRTADLAAHNRHNVRRAPAPRFNRSR